MKTTIIRAVAALSLAAAAVFVPAAADAYTDPVVVTVTPSVVTPGSVATFSTERAALQGDEDVIISITGAAANSITLASVATETNTSLRSKAVNGLLKAPVRFPMSAQGVYYFTFTGATSGVVLHATVTVTPASSANTSQGGLAATGFDGGSTMGLWIAGGALVVAGGAVGVGALVRRRRSGA